MPKIVISSCHGGFGLSEQGVSRYAELKGLTLYPEREHGLTTYWTVPAHQRPAALSEPWAEASLDARKAYNEACSASQIYDKDIARDDPHLIQVVEELGPAANGRYASLKVVEVPPDVEWQIDEYDGAEWVAEKHRVWC